jgi:nucleoside-diphosphate-sugar epimerase
MKILITGAASRLSQELADSLSGEHDVTLTYRTGVSTDHTLVQSELGHDEATNTLVRGMDAIVHSGEMDRDASATDSLDVAMRGTYNLLYAAAEEGVPRLVFLSSLRLLDRYDEDMVIRETWRPTPTTDTDVLCYHLGEFVCREYAREQKIDVVCLRLGELARDEPGEASSSALYPDDAIQAVSASVTAEISGWNIFHIQSAVRDARFTTLVAQEALGYAPTRRS